jgi:hypothetical protein
VQLEPLLLREDLVEYVVGATPKRSLVSADESNDWDPTHFSPAALMTDLANTAVRSPSPP